MRARPDPNTTADRHAGADGDGTPTPEPTATATPEPTATPSPAVTAVSVELGEYHVTPSVATVPAGTVDFTVTNVDRRSHQFIVIKTDLAPDALVMAGSAADPPASGTVIGQIATADLGSGATATASFELDAGSYVLICNRGSHYSRGMTVAFTVE
ncbi:MAG: cupredoxin domain-containing protein [Chloroflexi bacterium]|nr:cupredoxin domain-containing protein [Chloroflexota bacterium]